MKKSLHLTIKYGNGVWFLNRCDFNKRLQAVIYNKSGTIVIKKLNLYCQYIIQDAREFIYLAIYKSQCNLTISNENAVINMFTKFIQYLNENLYNCLIAC